MGTSTHSKTKEVFLWLSFGVLFLAAMLRGGRVGADRRRGRCPGRSTARCIFLGPGYGLFAGWLLFAAALNLSTAISYSSYPSGTLPWPETRTEYTHRGQPVAAQSLAHRVRASRC